MSRTEGDITGAPSFTLEREYFVLFFLSLTAQKYGSNTLARRKHPSYDGCFLLGGERGIRTLAGTLAPLTI